MKLFRYFLSELGSQKRFTLLFVLNLSLGLAGFIALDAFRVSIDQTMKSRSRKILGSDMGISARRPITEDEDRFAFSKLPKGSQQSKTTEFYSMIAPTKEGNTRSRLVKIKAVDEVYPFYGGMEFADGSKIEQEPFVELSNGLQVWIYKELLSQLDLEKGDELKVGQVIFKITKVITDDSTAGMGASFAPTIYIGQKNVPATELVQKGSVAWHSRLYKIPGIDEAGLEQLKTEIFEDADQQDLRVYTHLEASEQMARLLQTLNDYLGLVAIVALLLASVGTGFLYRSFFASKVRQIAILMTLGMMQRQAALFYMFQLVVLGFVSALVAMVAGTALLPLLGDLTQDLLAVPFVFVVPPQTLALALILGVVGSFLIGLPFLAQIQKLTPALLLKGDYAPSMGRAQSFINILLLSLPGLLSLWGLSIWQSHSFLVGSAFIGTLIVVAALLVVLARVSFSILNGLWGSAKFIPLRFAIKDIVSHPWTSTSSFLAMGLGAVLINLVPQVRMSLQYELQAPETSKLPSLFMFDIQEEQVGPLKKVAQQEKVKLEQVSAMVRARLTSVNGKEFDKGKGAGEGLSREEQREMRFRNRGFNLSYRDGLSDSESLYEGELFSGEFDESKQEYPFISLEKRFADRLSLKIGDVLEFDVESIPITGQVKNLRSVRWTSFRPNFFIQFQSGVLEPAPKTFIAVAESLPEDKRVSLQRAIVDVLPNVSMIDVTRLAAKITEIVMQMSVALLAMALLCIFAGFVVIYSISQHQAEKQRWQMGLLKVLGSSYFDVISQFLIQFMILTSLAAGLGVIVSVAMSYVISTYLFESIWVFDSTAPAASFLLIVGTTLFVVSFASFSALRVKPAALLNSR